MTDQVTGKSVPTNRRSVCQYCFRSWFIYLLGGNHKYEEGNVKEHFHFHQAIIYIKYNMRCRLSKIFSIFPRKMLGFVSFVGKMLAFTYLLRTLCNVRFNCASARQLGNIQRINWRSLESSLETERVFNTFGVKIWPVFRHSYQLSYLSTIKPINNHEYLLVCLSAIIHIIHQICKILK